MSKNDKKNLVIIEENVQNRELLSSLLSDEYNITAVAKTEEVRSLLKENDILASAILLNARNSKDDTIDFLNFVQNNAKLSGVPVLTILDENSTVEEINLIYHGAVDCIKKPFIGEVIKKRISNAILLKDSMTYYGIEKMLKELPPNIYLKDSKGRYIFATHYWHHLDHKNDSNWSIRGKTDVEIRKDKENAIAAQQKDMEIIETGKGASYTIEIFEDGIQEFYEVTKQPIFDDKGIVNGIVGIIYNVTEFETLKRKFQEKARTDELTGLYNRTYFYEYLNELEKEDSYPISIISADCDGLKEVNDTYGHNAGDKYIKMTVQLFQKVLPKAATLFRVGGDEFILILPSTTEDVAQQFIAEMKEKENMYRVEDQVLSVSYGISSVKGKDDSVEACIVESDRNMYFEKKNKKLEND